MRSVEKLDINNKEHAGFLFDLAMACKDELIDDYENDIILMVDKMQRGIASGSIKAFLCSVKGEKCGAMWVEICPREIGEIHAAMLPKFRDFSGHAIAFLKLFIPFCFNTLKLRKLRAMVPTYLSRPERLLRAYGFRKVGLHKAETLRNGKPESVVELCLLKNQPRIPSRLKNQFKPQKDKKNG
ncbi:MAG TPA: GNAT family protein [Oculatellaceae cyanobacterium]